MFSRRIARPPPPALGAGVRTQAVSFSRVQCAMYPRLASPQPIPVFIVRARAPWRPTSPNTPLSARPYVAQRCAGPLSCASNSELGQCMEEDLPHIFRHSDITFHCGTILHYKLDKAIRTKFDRNLMSAAGGGNSTYRATAVCEWRTFTFVYGIV